jgi:glycosyltransferase involved in cell wall biosynthesis
LPTTTTMQTTLVLLLLLTLFFSQAESVPSVIWYAPFFSGGGYCSEAISFVLGLYKLGVNIKIVQHGDSFNQKFVEGLPNEERLMLRDMIGNQNVDHRSSVVICHSEPGAWNPSTWSHINCPPDYQATFYKIGRTMFETDRIPKGWSKRLNKMDEIWVPSKFHLNTFTRDGPLQTKLSVLGEPVDTVFFNPTTAGTNFNFPDKNHNEKKTKFLSVFKWEKRKGWDVLLKAYFNEFHKNDNVVLYLLSNAFHSTSDFQGEIEKYIKNVLKLSIDNLPKIYVLKSGIPQALMPTLYNSVDALVQPSRGEGWGRPHCEAMASGLPIIATNFSGTTEFINEKNAYPLDIIGMSEIKEGAFKGHWWAEPSDKHLQSLMRRVVDNPNEAKEKGANARKAMLKYYAPDVMAKVIVEKLEEIEAKVNAAKDGKNKVDL